MTEVPTPLDYCWLAGAIDGAARIAQYELTISHDREHFIDRLMAVSHLGQKFEQPRSKGARSFWVWRVTGRYGFLALLEMCRAHLAPETVAKLDREHTASPSVVPNRPFRKPLSRRRAISAWESQ